MLYIRIVSFYALIAIIVSLFVHGSAATFARQLLNAVSIALIFLPDIAWLFAIALCVVSAGWYRPKIRARAIRVFVAVILLLFVQASFTTLKTAMPYLSGFHADHVLADIDRWLHGGSDPWRLLQPLALRIDAGLFNLLYGNVWALAGVFLPLLIAATDDDPARMRRFAFLYLFAWAGLGNAVALAGLSAGPVYFDQLHGGSRFAGLSEMLGQSGFADTPLGRYQVYLLTFFQSGQNDAATGISAFPSVHVAVASVSALYFAERHIALAPFGAAFVVVIAVLSVASGYHYAIDGYASILAVSVVWAWQRRRYSGVALRREAVPVPI